MKVKHLAAIAAMALMAPLAATADDYTALAPGTSVPTERNFSETLSLNNAGSVLGFQLNIVLPEGFEINTDGVSLNNERAANHEVRATLHGNEVIVTAVNLDSDPIEGTSGALLTLPLTAPFAIGDYQIEFNNILLAVRNGSAIEHVALDDFAVNVTVYDSTGVEAVEADEADVEWYDLRGIRVEEPSAGAIYVRRQGMNVELILVK